MSALRRWRDGPDGEAENTPALVLNQGLGGSFFDARCVSSSSRFFVLLVSGGMFRFRYCSQCSRGAEAEEAEEGGTLEHPSATRASGRRGARL